MELRAWKRLVATLLALVLTLGCLPTLALAEEDTNLCPHHPAHTPDCGYVEAVEGHACTHVCTETCTKETVTACVHEHSAEAGCTYVEAVEAKTCGHVCGDGECGYQPAKEAVPCNCKPTVQHAVDCASLTGGACTCTPETVHQEGCAYQAAVSEVPCDFAHESCGCQAAVPAHWECDHTCSAEFGCVKEVCTHVHSAECGYVEAVEGHLCEYHCEICEKAKACVCDEACTEDAPNSECPVCSANWEDCRHPRCTCARLCAEGAVDTDCPVCTDDYEKCTVQCTCTSACTEESVNSACPVCSVQWDYCNPVSLLGEDGYYIAPNTPDAELEAIKAYLRNPDAEANTVHFAAGTYENLELEIAGTKTLCMDGPVTFSGSAGKIAIQISQPNGANLTLRADSGAENASLTVTGYNHAIRIAGYNDGSHQWLPVSIKIPNLDVTLTECVNTDGTGSAIRINEQCNFYLNVGNENYNKTSGTRVTDESDRSRRKVASLTIAENSGAGIDIYASESGKLGTWFHAAVIDADMYLTNNGFSGFYTEGYNTPARDEICGYGEFTVKGGRFVADRNNGSGIAFNSIYLDYPNSSVKYADVPTEHRMRDNSFTAVDSYVSFSGNQTAQGINGGVQRYENCTVIADGNVSGNISADEISANNCYISACDTTWEWGHGIRIIDTAKNSDYNYSDIDPELHPELDPDTVTLAHPSVSRFKDSEIKAQNNGYNIVLRDEQINDTSDTTLISAIDVVFDHTTADFSNAKCYGFDGEVFHCVSMQNGSKLIVDHSGHAPVAPPDKGIAFINYSGNTVITDSYVSLLYNNISIDVHFKDGRNNSDFTVGRNAVVVVPNTQNSYNSYNRKMARSYIYVNGGSLQAIRKQMYFSSDRYSLNGHVSTDTNRDVENNDILNNYYAPLNAYGTMLNRFDLHASANKEVGATAQEVAAGASKSFTAYDVSGEAYNYQFRYTKAGEDAANAEASGTAYVWAPVSIIHYDATQGEVVASDGSGNEAKDSTAMMGNVALKNTRGDNAVLLNSVDGLPTGSRYATDYTIYGNSLRLSEGVLPSAEKDGVIFDGWYVRKENGTLVTDWLDQCTGSESGMVDWARFNRGLNTKVTDETKLIDLAGTGNKAAEEVTLYAKWVNSYKVEHYQQQKDGSYSLVKTDNRNGLAGDTGTYTNEDYSSNGYTFIPSKTKFVSRDSNNVETVLDSAVIPGNNSLVIKLYYDLTQYTVSYQYVDKGDGIPAKAPALSQTAKYYPQDAVTVAAPEDGATVKQDGVVYTFHGWTSKDITGTETAYKEGSSFRMPQKNVVFSGYWTKEASKPSHHRHSNSFLPSTGDQIFRWVILLAAATAGLTGLCIYAVKKKHKNRRK